MQKRIQRKRIKGWKAPDNALYVGRPSKWGNPFRCEGGIIYVDAGHRRKILDPWVYLGPGTVEDTVKLFRYIVMGTHEKWVYQQNYQYMNDIRYWQRVFSNERDLKEVKNRVLMCWCPEDGPCHADVLIEAIENLK